jgi:phosphoglucosamine mutase
MKRQYFGTDGVRGPVGGPLLNEDFVYRLGYAAGRFLLARSNGGSRPTALIGRDTRWSGPMLVEALAAGLTAAGADVVSLGVVPTPAIALAAQRTDAALAAAVTASHNPADDNGVKFFTSRGLKLADEDEAEIETLLLAGEEPPRLEVRMGAFDGKALYLDKVLSLLPAGALAGWRVAIDAAHGAAYEAAPEAFRRLGAEVFCIGIEPDGRNINRDCGSQHPEALGRLVRETGANLGVAHDGDADRLALCDERGQLLDGDELLCILARQALERGELPHRTLVATVQSNLGLKLSVEALGGQVVFTDVGDRYVAQEMMRGGYGIGGESSGHLIFSDYLMAGDGLAAALKVIAVMLQTGKPLSELRRWLTKLPQVNVTVAAPEKPPLDQLAGFQAALREAESMLEGRGRILARYSGTEPKLRLMVEAPDGQLAKSLVEKLQVAARSDLQVAAACLPTED